jgi:MFS superfamily sulfate permease-like transporter
VKKEVNEFIRQVVIEILAALVTSSVIFSGSSRLITGYWMRWFRTPFIYLWAVVAVLILAWIIRRRYQRKKNKISDA